MYSRVCKDPEDPNTRQVQMVLQRTALVGTDRGKLCVGEVGGGVSPPSLPTRLLSCLRALMQWSLRASAAMAVEALVRWEWFSDDFNADRARLFVMLFASLPTGLPPCLSGAAAQLPPVRPLPVAT